MRDLDPDTEAALRKAKKHVIGKHGADPNFAGAGLGFRFRGAEWTEEPVVTVILLRKRPEALVAADRLLPKTVEIDGKSWGVDVLQGGPFKLHATTAAGAPAAVTDFAQLDLARDIRRDALIQQKAAELAESFQPQTGLERPPLQGASISNQVDGQVAGTLGCYVIDSDGTICILSCNHVLARLNQGQVGESIVQPGGLDGGTSSDVIATLKRFAPLGDGTEVDAAIAQIASGVGVSPNVSGGLMAPISASHPAVAMTVAGDPFGFFNFLTRMDTTLASLGVALPGDPAPKGGVGTSPGVTRPKIGMNLEKVGRTTGYTSATILGLGFDVEVDTEGPLGLITYSDLVFTQFFQLPGDSGSVACAGGDGNVLVVLLFLIILLACPFLDALSAYYDLPLSNDQNTTLSDQLRDNFLSQSSTGQLLIGATYVNAQTVINRLNTDTGTAHNQSLAQARAQSLYNQFHDLAATLITSTSPTAVVTSSNLATVASILHGLAAPATSTGTGMLTSAESKAAWALYSDVLKPTVGMGREQLINYMNVTSVYNKVYSQLQAVPTVTVPGPVSAAPVKSSS